MLTPSVVQRPSSGSACHTGAKPACLLQGPGCFFFVVAPFCSCPASLVSRKCFAVGPGCAKCFFCCAPLGAATFRRGQSKKKKNTTQGVFFCSGPGERQGKEKPRWAPARGQSKKKHPGWCFFLLWPRAGAQRSFSFPCLSPEPEQKKHTGWCFFLLWPRAGAQRGFSFPCLSPGPQQKKTPCFFFFALAPCRHGASPSPAFPRGRSKKKNTLGGVVSLLRPRADAHSLTAGLGGDASPSPGWCFFFFCCGPARTGVVFFYFLLWPRPDAHSLTVGWGDFGKARVVFLFCCGPAGSF